jgi:hypothetical protein
MPHVLFVIEKKLNCTEEVLSNATHNLIGSYESCNAGTYSVIYFDEVDDPNKSIFDALDKEYPEWKDKSPLPNMEQTEYMIVVSCVCPQNLPLQALYRVKNTVKTALVWFDYQQASIINIENDFINIIIDRSDYRGPIRYSLWTPQDHRVFNDPGVDRYLDVSFVGNVGGYSERVNYINYLQKHVNFFHFGGSRGNRLSYEGYADIHKRSKICVNFSLSLNGFHHLKGRVFEIACCGGLLMEDEKNYHINRWFTPFAHYVPYSSPQDLVKKINYYLEREEERKQIARQAHEKATTLLSSASWWDAVIYNLRGNNLM